MSEKLIPIYTSKGDAEAFLSYPYLFNRSGEWIGFVTPQREIYSVFGEYVGVLTNDPRIIRKRSMDYLPSRITPPTRPPKMSALGSVPLAPMMSDLSHSEIDVLLDEPERLHTLDGGGEFREDMD